MSYRLVSWFNVNRVASWLNAETLKSSIRNRQILAIVSSWCVLDASRVMSEVWRNSDYGWLISGFCVLGLALSCYCIGVLVGYRMGKQKSITILKDDNDEWRI